jgi:hypothetical protein
MSQQKLESIARGRRQIGSGALILFSLLRIIAEMTAQADQINSKRLNLEKATNFMRQYRDPHSRELKKLSANQFMEVWSHYDKDGE